MTGDRGEAMRGERARRSRWVAAACLALSLLALLLWGRLKLVTAVPRTAYAKPERAKGVAPASQPGQAEPAR